jgi:hypothetical protein
LPTSPALPLPPDGAVLPTPDRDPGTLAPSALTRFSAPSLTFEENHGQTEEGLFVARGAGFQASLDASGATLLVAPAPGAAPDSLPSRLRIHFTGANPSTVVTGVDPLPGVNNYYLTPDPSGWQGGSLSFARVTVQDLYPGIDLDWHASADGRLEYDLRLAPGADVSAIRLEFDGVAALTDDGAGGLVVHTEAGDVTMQQPALLEDVSGSQHAVMGQYVLEAGTEVGFAAQGHTPDRPLLIDPVLSFPSPVSFGALQPTSVAADAAGNVYVAGTWNSPTGGADAFVRKLSADGSTVLYTSYFGGSGAETTPTLAVSPGGQVALAGGTTSANLPVLQPFQAAPGGGKDGFVAVFNSSGGLTQATYLGGAGDDAGHDVAFDPTGRVVVAGDTVSNNFPVAAAVQAGRGGGQDAFLTRFDAAGTRLSFSSYWGGSNDESGTALAVDAAGNLVLAGTTSSGDLATTAGALQRRYGGGDSDGYLVRVLASNNAVGSATYSGGGGVDAVADLAVDAAGAAYLTGRTRSDDLLLVNPYQARGGANHTQADDAFVAKVNATGGGLVYATYLGGSTSQRGLGIGVDALGQAIRAGHNQFRGLPPGQPAGTARWYQ